MRHQGEKLTILARKALYDDLAQSQLDSQFLNKLSTKPPVSEGNTVLNHFIVTASHKNTLRLFEEHFAIRNLKLTHDLQAGISGLLLEGPSGIGKSEMVIEYLRTSGFQDGYTADSMRDTTHRYYRLTPTHLAEMERVILKAYHEGAVVIIDELNTLPLEKMLNSLLSEGTDLQGDLPRKKGFFVVATQNPTFFKGRQILSGAFLNRFHRVVLPPYPREELIEILIEKGQKGETAKALVDKFERDVQQAKEDYQIPPTPRELLKVANEFLEQPDCHEIQEKIDDRTKIIGHDQIADSNERAKITEKINLAANSYLYWMSKHATGTRGITRFSHWYHGESGRKRAGELLEAANDSNQDLQSIKKILAKAFRASSDHKHSLSRYLLSEFGGQKISSLENKTDEEFANLKRRFDITLSR
jgi:hypothetical protein